MVKIAIKRMPHETTKQKRKNYQEIRFLKYLSDKPSPDFETVTKSKTGGSASSSAISSDKANRHILRYIRATLYQNEIWLATEFLSGGTLADVRACH